MKKKIMAVLLALAMVTQGAMPVFAQNEGAEGIETAADAETAKILCKEYLSEEQQIQGIDQRFEIPQEDVSFVNDLGSGTITLSFLRQAVLICRRWPRSTETSMRIITCLCISAAEIKSALNSVKTQL